MHDSSPTIKWTPVKSSSCFFVGKVKSRYIFFKIWLNCHTQMEVFYAYYSLQLPHENKQRWSERHLIRTSWLLTGMYSIACFLCLSSLKSCWGRQKYVTEILILWSFLILAFTLILQMSKILNFEYFCFKVLLLLKEENIRIKHAHYQCLLFFIPSCQAWYLCKITRKQFTSRKYFVQLHLYNSIYCRISWWLFFL